MINLMILIINKESLKYSENNQNFSNSVIQFKKKNICLANIISIYKMFIIPNYL